MHQSVITVSAEELKAIFEDSDIVRLEYPANEFPTHQTKIILVFTQKSGKKSQYIELQEWLNLLEDYKNSQQSTSTQPNTIKVPQYGHGKEFVCIIVFRVNDDDDNVSKIVVSSNERNDCINAILEKYPNDHLDISTEFMCKQCFEEMLAEQLIEDLEFSYPSSRMIH
jgi:hypothetical protein